MTVLFVVLTIVLALTVDWLLHRRRTEAPVVDTATPASVRVPSGVFFARSHTWLNMFPSGHAWLGIDDFVVRLLSAPRVRFLVEAGAHVRRGEPVVSLEEGEHALTIRSPIDGRILSFNAALQDKPETLHKAPFCDGWVCDIRPDRYSDMKALLLGDETHAWMEAEFGRLRDVFAGAGGEVQPAMLQDGGPPIAGAMKHVSDEVWKRFDREFLEVR
jgi:glycine cleavage system H protein